MAVNWTKDQLKAIEQPNANVLVAAAAGSGKTTVLVERIIRQITDKEHPVDVDSMLITTFTEAAAQTMRQKLVDAIAKQLATDPNNKNLLHQMIGVNRADICTIHSFCLKVIRNNFHLLDIDPEFTIGDTNELELLKLQIADELFDELYEAEDADFIMLTQIYSTQKSDENLTNILLKMYSFIKSMPFYEDWIKGQLNALEMCDDIDATLRAAKIKESAKILVDSYIDKVCEATEYALSVPQISGYGDTLKDDLNVLNDIKNALNKDWDTIVDTLESAKLKKLSGAAKGVSDEIKAPVTGVRDALKKSCIGHMQAKMFYAKSDIVYEDMAYEKTVVSMLCRLFSLFDEKYSAAKRERNVLDFNDLEHICLEVLSKRDGEGNIIASEAALELRARYSQLLVDEYQDSNELQEAIFSLVSNGHNLFMVGDMKQSIYRFRHTNPMLFKHKKDTYTEDGENDIRIIMGMNFRSRREIVDGVNNIFEQITSQTVGEIDYDESEKLYFGAAEYPESDDNTARVELNIIGANLEHKNRVIVDDEDNDALDELKEISSIEKEAHYTARRILELIDGGYTVYDSKEKSMRPIKYKDIVILLRSTKTPAPIYCEVLTQYGIPVFSDSDSGYFMSEEVRLILSLLSIIDNPRQDIRLLAVMRSSIGGFDEQELLEIRMADRHSDIYGALMLCAGMEGGLAKKCRAFLSKLNDFRDMSKYLTTHQLIWEIYKKTNYYICVGAMRDGELRQANLILLYERARKYEQTGFKGLFSFVNFIENLQESSHDMGNAKILGENQNLVRIMSIHKSKGLEFPVVFVSSMARKFNTQDDREKIALHSKLGVGIDYVDTTLRYHYPCLGRIAIKETVKYENLSEELRLLYVAFTRAKELLIMSASAADARKRTNAWLACAKRAGAGEKMKLHDVASAKSPADMVIPAVLRNISCREVLEEYGFIENGQSCDWQVSDDSRFRLRFYDEMNLLCEETYAADTEDNLSCTEDYSELIDKRLAERYAYESAANIPSKVSVTELKRISNFELDAKAKGFFASQMISMPEFLSESTGLSAAQKGTVVHYIMQNISLTGDVSEQHIAEQIMEFKEKQMLTEEQALSVDASKIAAFFESDLGKRMLASKNVMRELPFEIEIAASEVYGESGFNEKLLLQGIIDCCFEENGKIIIVDYKTDFLENTDEAKDRIKKKYLTQLEYYKIAAEKILKKEVSEKNLYLFSVNSVVEC